MIVTGSGGGAGVGGGAVAVFSAGVGVGSGAGVTGPGGNGVVPVGGSGGGVLVEGGGLVGGGNGAGAAAFCATAGIASNADRINAIRESSDIIRSIPITINNLSLRRGVPSPAISARRRRTPSRRSAARARPQSRAGMPY
ncbi:MAG: hypothetical protein AB7O91_09920 [Sphingomonas sp.]